MRPAQPKPLHAAPPWVKRLGVGGFLFFLAKGLLWLTVPAVLALTGVE